MATAAVMTYTSLVADISSYLERTDTATLEKIPTFIMLAEQIIASQIKFLGNLTVAQSTMVATQPIIDKPARWRKTVSMNVVVGGKREPVLLRKYEYVRSYWPPPERPFPPGPIACRGDSLLPLLHASLSEDPRAWRSPTRLPG
jgi:hypothetical protein